MPSATGGPAAVPRQANRRVPTPEPGNSPQNTNPAQAGPTGGAFDEPPRSGSPAFGDDFGMALGDSGSSTASRPQIPMDGVAPGAGAAAVAKRLLAGGKDGGAGGGVPHVSSAPVLSAMPGGGAEGVAWSSEQRDKHEEKSGEGGSGDGGKGGKSGAVEQAPKSEPKIAPKGKKTSRRASAGGVAVTAKPGRLAKMMSKWLYPEAKVGGFYLL